MDKRGNSRAWVLWIGDAVAYLIVTLAGFMSHGILDSSKLVRILATFLPFYTSWLLFALWGRLHRVDGAATTWILRAGVTAMLAAPFASTLRALWLGAPIQATFVLVMAGVSATGVVLWRLLFLLITRHK